MKLQGIYFEIIKILEGHEDDEAPIVLQIKKWLNIGEKPKKQAEIKIRNLREVWHRKLRCSSRKDHCHKEIKRRSSSPQNPGDESDSESLSTDVERTKQYVPKIKQRAFNQIYSEVLCSAPIGNGEIITKLYQCRRMLEEFATIQKPIDDEFKKLLSLAKLQADWDVGEWYENAVKEHERYMKPYLHVMLYLLRCQVKKHRKLLEDFTVKRWKVVSKEEQQKLFNSMRALEDKMKTDRRISSYYWKDINQAKFTSDSEMYFIKSLEEFNNLQKHKLKVGARVMTLFEIEHTQQIVDHTRNEFLRLEKIEAEHYCEIEQNYLKLQTRAQKIKDDIKQKSELNSNLHGRIITIKGMFKHILDQLFKLMNFYLEENNCTDVAPLSMFDIHMFADILGEKARECLKNKRHFFPKDMLDFILQTNKDEYDKLNFVRVTEGDLNFGRLNEEGSDNVSTAEEILDQLIHDAIPTPPSKRSVSFSEESDYVEILKNAATLAEDAVEQRREQETQYHLVGDDLYVPRGLSPKVFIQERMNVIMDVIRKNKHLIGTLFEP